MSRRLENQLTYCRLVLSTIKTSRKTLREALKEELGAKGADQLGDALALLGAHLSEQRERYERALDQVSGERSEDAEARDRVQAHQGALVRALQQGRYALLGALGEEALTAYTMQALAPETREGLLRYGRTALDRLKQAPRRATDAFGVEFDTAPIAATLTTKLEAFSEAFDALSTENKQTEQRRAERDQAAERFRRVLVNVAATLEGALRLGQLDYTADRVRPTSSRVLGDELVEFDEPITPEAT